MTSATLRAAVPSPGLFLVGDFETTCCDRGSVPQQEMEIIKFAAVLAHAADGRAVATLDHSVRPIRHPVLTPFCTALTGIGQHQVAAAAQLPEVISDFRHWLNAHRDLGLIT